MNVTSPPKLLSPAPVIGCSFLVTMVVGMALPMAAVAATENDTNSAAEFLRGGVFLFPDAWAPEFSFNSLAEPSPITYAAAYSNAWTSSSGTRAAPAGWNFSQWSSGANASSGQVDGKLFTVDGTLTGASLPLQVGQVFLIRMGGETDSGRSGITNGGRIGFTLGGGTNILNGTNALARATNDSRLRVQYIGGASSAEYVGAGSGVTSQMPGFTDFKGGQWYAVEMLSRDQFTLRYGTNSSAGTMVYNIEDFGGTAGAAIGKITVFNLGANMASLFANIVVSNAPYLNYSNNTGETDAVSGLIENNGATANSVVKNGAGTVRITGTNNTYTGTTTVSNGVLVITNGSAIADANAVIMADVAGAVLRVESSETIGSLRGGGSTGGNIDLRSGVVLTVAESGAQIFGGSITNAGSLTKSGNGTLTLTGNNTYSGQTAVNAGTLALDASTGSAAANSSGLTVAAGATLLFSRSAQIADTAAVSLSGGTILRASGVNEVFGNLAITQASTIDFGSGESGTLRFGIYQNNQTPSSLLALHNFFPSNSFVFSSTSFSAGNIGSYFTFTGSFGGYSLSNTGSEFTITAIPEPPALVALAGVLLLSVSVHARASGSARLAYLCRPKRFFCWRA